MENIRKCALELYWNFDVDLEKIESILKKYFDKTEDTPKPEKEIK